MKYILKDKVGSHYENGVEYEAGEVIESDADLIELFPNKFEKAPADAKVKKGPALPAGIVTAGTRVTPPGKGTAESPIRQDNLRATDAKLKKKGEDDDDDEDEEEDDDEKKSSASSHKSTLPHRPSR